VIASASSYTHIADTAATPETGLVAPEEAAAWAIAPLGARPEAVAEWFEDAAIARVPAHDGTLGTARLAAAAYARQAKAANTRRAYRASVAAWTGWCSLHGLPALPGRPADVAAFLAHERGRGLCGSTVAVRRAAIRYLHHLADLVPPTDHPQVAEMRAGLARIDAGPSPARKAAIMAEALGRILEGFAGQDGLAGLRDRALLLLGFAGALRRSELAAIAVADLGPIGRHGLILTLPRSKGERSGKAASVAILAGGPAHCPIAALAAWLDASGVQEGPVFRRVWRTPTGCESVGWQALGGGSIARIVQRRCRLAGLVPAGYGGHSLRRGALSDGMARNVHPARLKAHARHKSYAALDAYLDMGDAFDNHPLRGVL
jgi:integrase